MYAIEALTGVVRAAGLVRGHSGNEPEGSRPKKRARVTRSQRAVLPVEESEDPYNDGEELTASGPGAVSVVESRVLAAKEAGPAVEHTAPAAEGSGDGSGAAAE